MLVVCYASILFIYYGDLFRFPETMHRLCHQRSSCVEIYAKEQKLCQVSYMAHSRFNSIRIHHHVDDSTEHDTANDEGRQA